MALISSSGRYLNEGASDGRRQRVKSTPCCRRSKSSNKGFSRTPNWDFSGQRRSVRPVELTERQMVGSNIVVHKKHCFDRLLGEPFKRVVSTGHRLRSLRSDNETPSMVSPNPRQRSSLCSSLLCRIKFQAKESATSSMIPGRLAAWCRSA